MTQALIYDRGRSLFFGCEALEDDESPQDLTGVTVTCNAEHKESGRVVAMDLVWVDRSLGRFEFAAPGDGLATDWQTGAWEASVVLSRPNAGPGGRDLVLGTETIQILLRKAP